MKNENNIRQTIRISQLLYDKLNIIAKENQMSVNKLIVNILNYYIDSFKTNNTNNINNNFKEVLISIENVVNKIDKINGKLNSQFDLTKQVFLNSGFRKNRTEKEDDIYREYISSKYKD